MLLAAMMVMPMWAQLPEENHNLNLGTHGIGEIVTIPDLEGVVFHNSYEQAPLPESAYTQGDYSYVRVKVTDRGWTDPAYYWQYELAGIWCMNNGEDVIHLTRYEFDEGGSPIKQHNYTITITVAGGMVEVGTWEPGCSTETPDATVLKDTTIHYGESYYDENYQWHEAPIKNFVGFRYVSSCYESNGEMVKSWFCVSPGDISVESGNTEVVTVEWNDVGNYFEIKGLKRGTATITVSAAAVIDPMNSEPKHVAKSVSYQVMVTGDAGPNISFCQNYSTITEPIVLNSPEETPYWTIYLLENEYTPYEGNFTITSSNPAVATIDNPTSNEVQFTFHGYGTTIITATVPATETTEEATASFTLIYEDPNATDMYFTDYEGNRIDTMNVGTDENGNPVYPYTNPGNYYTGVRLVIKKHSNDEDMSGMDVTIMSEDASIVQINHTGRDANGWYTQFECLAFGETDIVATFAGDNWDEQGGYYTYSPATARLHINYVNTYRKEATIHFAYDYVEGTSFSQTDGDCGHRYGFSIPAIQVWMKDETTGNTVYYEDPLPLTVTVSDESIAEVTYDENTHFITYNPRAYGTATVVASFAGDETYAVAAATFTFSFNKNTTPMAECTLRDEYNNVVTSMEVTEGDLIESPHLYRVDGEDLCYTYLAMATTTDRSRWRLKPSTGHWDYYYPKEAGLDTIVFTYYRLSFFDNHEQEIYQYWDQAVEVRIPVVINPKITPVAAMAQTQMNINPATSSNLSFSETVNDFYNATEEQLEIRSVVDPVKYKLAIDSMAAGTKDWNDLLPGATTFNVQPGRGKVKIQCETAAGYELKVLVRGHGTVSVSQPSMGIAEVSYNVDKVTTVLVYLSQTSGSSSAPKHAPAATKDASPKAIIKSILVSPQFDIEAKQDPDNADKYYSTFFDSEKKYALPNDGTKAYVAKINSEGNMVMTEIAKNDEVIPANTAVILQATSAAFALTPSEGVPVSVPDGSNQLQGTDDPMAAPTNCYVLSGHSTDNETQGVGFYQFAGTLAEHKAYIIYSGPSLAPSHRMRFIFSNEQGATDIETVTGYGLPVTEKRIENGQLVIIKNGVRYNAQGQIVK